jgi:uncharacterized protein (TIGR02147 family)
VSASAFKMILSGARNLTVPHIHSFAKALCLSPQEHDYFEALVLFEQSSGSEEKNFYKKRLRLVQDAGAVPTRLNLRDVVKEWFVPAVLIYLIDQEGAPNLPLLAEKLQIPEAKVRETIESLRKLGILEMGQGKKAHFVMDKFASNFSKQIYLKKLVPVIQVRVESEFHSPNSYFETHTLSLSEAKFRAFLEDYKLLVERLMAASESEKTRVYQLFISAFPVI